MLNDAIEWLADRLLEEYPDLANKTVKNHPEVTPKEWVKLRISWGIPKGFTYFWNDHMGMLGAMMIRPATDDLIVAGSFDYWTHIFDFDCAGDILWVDFAYGPGLYHKMIALCRTSDCERIGWRHRNRIHISPMTRMPSKTMKLSFHL